MPNIFNIIAIIYALWKGLKMIHAIKTSAYFDSYYICNRLSYDSSQNAEL